MKTSTLKLRRSNKMWLWWLLLITISLASGDLQNYDFYDPDEEDISYKNSEEAFQKTAQKILPFNLEVDYIGTRKIRGEEQGKRLQRFHSWGGKRYGTQGADGDNMDFEQGLELDQEEIPSYQENSLLNMSDFVMDDRLFGLQQKRAKHPAFSSWGGKRNSKVINRDEKRLTYDLEPGVYKIWKSDQNRKRHPTFNSWAGKRAASFNKWGEKRAPAFNSWGGKRDAAFNSWGGKRHAAFNSWGGKRNAAFNSWGGKRNSDFNSWEGKRDAASNSWGEKRAAAFNSWGGKRDAAFNSWGGKRTAAFNSWGGKRDLKEKNLPNVGNNEEIIAPYKSKVGMRPSKNYCIKFQSLCEDLCTSLENLEGEKSQPFREFEPKEGMIRIENLCKTCFCFRKENKISKQLIPEMLREALIYDFNNIEKRKDILEAIKDKIIEKYKTIFETTDPNTPPNQGKKRYDRIETKPINHLGFNHILYKAERGNENNFKTRFLKPEAEMNVTCYEDKNELFDQNQRQFNPQEISKDVLYTPLNEIYGSTTKYQQNNEAFTFNNNEQKITDGNQRNEIESDYDYKNKENIDFKYPINVAENAVESLVRNIHIPEDIQHSSTESSKDLHSSQDSNNFPHVDYTDHFPYTSDGVSKKTPNLNYALKLQPKNHELPNWVGKRSPIFHTWYENKVPRVQLSNGKRRPAFSSWGGKRSEQPALNNFLDECISYKEGKTCKKRIENFTSESESGEPLEDSVLRQKRAIDEHNQEYGVLGKTYDKTLNRDKRSNINSKKNRDITRIVFQRGFAWPMMVKSFSKGIDFYAWGGKRSL